MHDYPENPSGLHSISPIDGRYWNAVRPLAQFFSEFALIRQRVVVELRYLKALSDLSLPQFPPLGTEHILVQLVKAPLISGTFEKSLAANGNGRKEHHRYGIPVFIDIGG